MKDNTENNVRKPTLMVAMIPIVFMIVSLYIGIAVLDLDAHIPLLISGVVATIVAMWLGFSWKEIEVSFLNTIRLSMQAIIILLVIGAIIGSWIAGGIVPTMIFYGLELLSPTYFLVSACAICCVVALASGNAWTATGTIGIAIMGIGEGLGMNTAMVAGAVISGVYFGDKVSPLSETTNMAPGITGAELFEHIKHMMYTTVPALAIALVLYTVIGLRFTNVQSNIGEVRRYANSVKRYFPYHTMAPYRSCRSHCHDGVPDACNPRAPDRVPDWCSILYWVPGDGCRRCFQRNVLRVCERYRRQCSRQPVE